MCVCVCAFVFFFVKVASVMDICLFWQPAKVLCVDCIVILCLNKILLLLISQNYWFRTLYRNTSIEALSLENSHLYEPKL